MPEAIVYEDVVTYPAVFQDLAFMVSEETAAGAGVWAETVKPVPRTRAATARATSILTAGLLLEGLPLYDVLRNGLSSFVGFRPIVW